MIHFLAILLLLVEGFLLLGGVGHSIYLPLHLLAILLLGDTDENNH
jgi:hypothetical protein